MAPSGGKNQAHVLSSKNRGAESVEELKGFDPSSSSCAFIIPNYNLTDNTMQVKVMVNTSVALQLSALKWEILKKRVAVVGKHVQHDYLFFVAFSVSKEASWFFSLKPVSKYVSGWISANTHTHTHTGAQREILTMSHRLQKAQHHYKSIHCLTVYLKITCTVQEWEKWQVKMGNRKWNPSAGDDNDLTLHTEWTKTPTSFKNTRQTKEIHNTTLKLYTMEQWPNLKKKKSRITRQVDW